MNLREKANLVIYRFRERGLEIFLVNSGSEDEWSIPQEDLHDADPTALMEEEKIIALDPVENEQGEQEDALALEGDWHEIPSLKAMLYEDAVNLKDKVKEMEKGTYFAFKEAFKKVLPHQYKFLSELKEILVDRNSTRDI